jgi:endoglucanase
VVKRLLKTAHDEDIPIQHEASSRFSGTDTDDIFWLRGGIPSALVSLPLRYMHSVVECVDLKDVQQVIDLLTAFALSIKPDEEFGHRL